MYSNAVSIFAVDELSCIKSASCSFKLTNSTSSLTEFIDFSINLDSDNDVTDEIPAEETVTEE